MGEVSTTEVPQLEPVTPEETTSGRVARNTMVLIGSQVITFALTFTWTVVIQHTLGDSNVGRLFTAQSLAAIGLVFMDAGVAVYLTKRIARERDQTPNLLGTAYGLRLFSGLTVLAILLGAAYLLGYDQQTFLCAVICVAGAIAAAYKDVTNSAFQGHELMKWTALGNIVEKFAVTSLTVILLLLGFGLLTVATIVVVGTLSNIAVIGFIAWRRRWIRFRFDWKMMRTFLAGGAPFFLWASFSVIYGKNAALQLAAMTDPATTGHFGVAMRMYESLGFVPYIFNMAVFPVLSRAFVHAADQMQRTARRSFDLILMAALPISVGVIMLSPQIVDFVSKREEFVASIIPLSILGLSLIPLYLDMMLGTILISVDKQKQWAYVAIVATLFNPLLNWILIRWSSENLHNGAIGAALVTLLTEIVIFFFYIRLIPRGILSKTNLIIAIKLAIAAGGMGVVLWLLLPVFNSIAPAGGTGKLGAGAVIAMSALVGCATYLLLAWVQRAIHADEYRLLQRAFTRAR